MDHEGDQRRRGDHELGLAARAATIAVVTGVLAQVTSSSPAPLALSVTFLLYLAALLAGARAAVAVSVALWRRRHA